MSTGRHMSNSKEYQQVMDALREHSETVLAHVAADIIHLGARCEWSMEDNFSTTEGLAGLATRVGLPSAGDQSDEDLAFYERAGGLRGWEQ